MPLEPPLSKLDQLKNQKSQQREKIFFHKLAYDLKVSAINSEQNLHIYEVEVDDAGYDIIVDDGYNEPRRFQLKTRLNPGGATSWKCHTQLFCPTPCQGSKWNLNEWINRETWGYNGGFILMDISWNEGAEPIVNYRYCDLSILMAIRDGYFKCANKKNTAQRVLKDTYKQFYDKKAKVDLPQSVLVKPKNNKCLLSLMGYDIWLPKTGDYTACFLESYSETKHSRTLQSKVSSLQCLFKALDYRVL